MSPIDANGVERFKESERMERTKRTRRIGQAGVGLVVMALIVVAIWLVWPRERLLTDVAHPVVKVDVEYVSLLALRPANPDCYDPTKDRCDLGPGWRS